MVMSVGAHELQLFVENDGDLYRRQGQPILKSLTLKKAKGEYDRAKAVKAYMGYMEAGAKMYASVHGDGEHQWNKMFPKTDREQAALAFVMSFETEHALGNYSGYLPKKYQAAAKPAPTKPAPKKRR